MVDKEKLEKELRQLGFPLMETQQELDVNSTLADVVRSHDTRLWEGFPGLLVKAAKLGDFKREKVESCLKNKTDVGKWRKLFLMSLALYPVMKRRFAFADRLEKDLSSAEKKWVDAFRNKARTRTHENFTLENKELNFSRMKTFLDNYMQEESVKLQQTQAKSDELSLEFALSQVFSPKQKELFWKKVKGEVFTKTEKEYFSRSVKKKVLALANAELGRLAQRLLG